MDAGAEVPLPFSVDRLLEQICVQKLLQLPDASARESLSMITEESAIGVLTRISKTSTRIYNLSSYIKFMVNRYGSSSVFSHAEVESISSSSHYPPSPSSTASSSPQSSLLPTLLSSECLNFWTFERGLYDSPTSTSKEFLESPYSCKGASPVIPYYHASARSSHETDLQQQFSSLHCSSPNDAIPAYMPSVSRTISPCLKNHIITSPSSSANGIHTNQVNQNFCGSPSAGHCDSPVQKRLFTPFGSPIPNHHISWQSEILAELEFRKLFLVHSYIGRLEDSVTIKYADEVISMKTYVMSEFEDQMWCMFGSRHCQLSDRARYVDSDYGKTHSYTCEVRSDGSYQFKGPYLDKKRTHLHRGNRR